MKMKLMPGDVGRGFDKEKFLTQEAAFLASESGLCPKKGAVFHITKEELFRMCDARQQARHAIIIIHSPIGDMILEREEQKKT